MIEFLEQRFPEEPLALTAGRYGEVLRAVASAGLIGGSVYDALIGATVLEHGATLLTRDRRALASYEVVGVEVEVVG